MTEIWTAFVSTSQVSPKLPFADQIFFCHVIVGGSDESTDGKITASQRRALDFVNYKPRSFWKDMKPWGAVKPQWKEVPRFWCHLGQLLFFPGVFWLVLCSGALLGTYILMSAVFAQVLISPPYNFNPNYLGFVMGGQAVVAFVVQPIAGYGSDLILRMLTKRNNGVSEVCHPIFPRSSVSKLLTIIQPEYRLIPALIPAVVGIVSCVIYGRSCQYPEDWAWTGIVITMNALFYSFVSIVVLGFVYTMDCYPQRGHVAMVALCAGKASLLLISGSTATNPTLQGEVLFLLASHMERRLLFERLAMMGP